MTTQVIFLGRTACPGCKGNVSERKLAETPCCEKANYN